MRRKVLAVVGAAAGVVLLSGCTALDLPLAAVTVDADGTARVLLRPCGDDTYRGPGLSGWAGSFEDQPMDDDADTTVWKATGERSGDTEFALFSPPAAWEAERGGEQRQRLVSGYTYQLTFSHRSDDYNGTVAFTVVDLSALEAGQVWADDRAMSLGEFEELAEDSC